MAQRYYDRVKETTTVTGTGSATLLGAPTQFTAFSARFASGAEAVADPLFYAIVGQSGGEWEVGRGYLSDSTTLVRVAVFDSSSGLSTPCSFSAGTKDVFCTAPAQRIDDTFTKGQAVAIARGAAMP